MNVNVNSSSNSVSYDNGSNSEHRRLSYSDELIDRRRAVGSRSPSSSNVQSVRANENTGYPDDLYRTTLRPDTPGMGVAANDDAHASDNDEHEKQLQHQWSYHFREKRARTRSHRRRLRLRRLRSSPASPIIHHHDPPAQLSSSGHNHRSHQLPIHNDASPAELLIGRNRRESRFDFGRTANNRHHQFSATRTRPRRFCSARDPSTLAFEAPTVFEGKLRSMSSDRRRNFSVTFEVKQIYKRQLGYKLPMLIRLQFSHRNYSECDIYRETFRSRGFVRDELEPGKLYLLFVNQIDLGNFTILGQPIKRTKKAVNDVINGVSAKYGEQFFHLYIIFKANLSSYVFLLFFLAFHYAFLRFLYCSHAK